MHNLILTKRIKVVKEHTKYILNLECAWEKGQPIHAFEDSKRGEADIFQDTAWIWSLEKAIIHSRLPKRANEQ